MFYFRFYLYRILKPFIRPLSPGTAFKYHYTALFIYIFLAANGAAYAWKRSKTTEQYVDPDELGLTEVDKRMYSQLPPHLWSPVLTSTFLFSRFQTKPVKDRLLRQRRDAKKIICIGGEDAAYEAVPFNLEEYQAEKEKLRKEIYEKMKQEAMI